MLRVEIERRDLAHSLSQRIRHRGGPGDPVLWRERAEKTGLAEERLKLRNLRTTKEIRRTKGRKPAISNLVTS